MTYTDLATSDMPGDVAILIRKVVRDSDEKQEDALRSLLCVVEREQIPDALLDRIRDNALRVMRHSKSSNKYLFVRIICASVWNPVQVDSFLGLAYSEKDDDVLQEIVYGAVKLAHRFPMCIDQICEFLADTIISCDFGSVARLAADKLNNLYQMGDVTR